MKRTFPILILSLALVFSFASADESAPAAQSPLKADLKAVVASGKVESVNGITTAGQPDEAGFKVFADNGYVAVIDLRTKGEDRGLDEPAVVDALGMEYVNFPIGRDGITFENARMLEGIMVRYDQPVLVHCGSSNRVGALFALNEYLVTKDVKKALAAGREAGLTSMEGAVKKVLETE